MIYWGSIKQPFLALGDWFGCLTISCPLSMIYTVLVKNIGKGVGVDGDTDINKIHWKEDFLSYFTFVSQVRGIVFSISNKISIMCVN